MMRSAIPTFRLPRDVLDAEIGRLRRSGYRVRVRAPGHRSCRRDAGDFDAALLAIGAQLSHRAYIPAGQSARVLDALQLLGDVAGGERPLLGRRVVVYGGGNTAMDAARTARRLGADEALVVYRRTRERMPANEIELSEALGEGVTVRWLSTITAVEAGRLTVERMQLDADGRPQPTGETEELDSDCVVLALGQDVDHSALDALPGLVLRDGVVEVDSSMMTGQPGVFAGGDMVPSARSVAVAVGHGRRAARSIEAWLARNPVGPPEQRDAGHVRAAQPLVLRRRAAHGARRTGGGPTDRRLR